jgi:hypothetical protein
MADLDIVQFFSMWETGAIGLNITRSDGTQIFVDLTREYAGRVLLDLEGACKNFDDLEQLCKEHDEYCEHQMRDVGGSCARCEGT